jgi:xanthosine utilization system XapX-like protein
VGLAIGAIFLVLGKQDAANKLTATVLGIIVLVVGKSIVSFIQNIA